MPSKPKSVVSARRPKVKTRVSPNIKKYLEDAVRDDQIITPRYDAFMAQWDGRTTPQIARKVARLITTPDRDRRHAWSGSSAGMCLRRQEFSFLGMPINKGYDPQLNRIYLNGTWAHLRTQVSLATAGIIDNFEVTHKKPSRRIRCTMDGIGEVKNGRYIGAEYVLEFKSRNEYAYNWQIIKGVDDKTTAQMDFTLLVTGLDVGVVMNENKNNQGVREWVVPRDNDRVFEMAKQVKELNKAIDKGKLHPQLEECRKQNKTGEFFRCPFGGRGGVCAAAGNWPNEIPA